MQPFMFQIKSVPMPQNKNFDTIGGAYVHVWVMDNSLENAQKRAFAHIRKYNWEPQEILNAFEIRPEQIPLLHKDEENLFLMAQLYGISADFLGWRKEESLHDVPEIIEP